MLIKKAYKFRLYPNKVQAEIINKTIGCARFVFNFVLGQQRKQETLWSSVEALVQNGTLMENAFKSSFFNKIASIKDIPKLKKHYPWLKEVDAIALQASVEDVADAYTRYYKKQNKKPRFKSKKNPVQAYTTKYTNGNIAILDKHIKLPKLGLVRFAKSKEVDGLIKRATIRRTPSGKYYIAILVETDVHRLPKTGSSIGIDVGLAHFATLSNGTQYENPTFFQKLELKLAKAQRILSHRKEGGANWNKQRIKIARIHEAIHHARTDYLHKLSTTIIKNHDVIGVEALKVTNMLKKRSLAKKISDVSWTEFRTMLQYKAQWYGKKVILVNPQHTSQCCHVCGHIEKANRISQAEFVCQSCGHTENADINASKNIEVLALAN